jgi:hypothetical protein
MEDPEVLCRKRQPLSRIQKRRRRRAPFRAKLFEAARAAIFGFQRSKRRRQTRLRQEQSGSTVSSAVRHLPPANNCEMRRFLSFTPSTTVMLHLPAFRSSWLNALSHPLLSARGRSTLPWQRAGRVRLRSRTRGSPDCARGARLCPRPSDKLPRRAGRNLSSIPPL